MTSLLSPSMWAFQTLQKKKTLHAGLDPLHGNIFDCLLLAARKVYTHINSEIHDREGTTTWYKIIVTR